MTNEEQFGKKSTDEFEVWSFPCLSADNIDYQLQIPDTSGCAPETQKLSEEVEELKNTLSQQLVLVAEIHKAMQIKISEIDEVFIQKINTLIRKTVERILNKELRQDPSLLVDCVKATLEEIADKDPAELLLSSEDFQIWQQNDLTIEGIVIKEDIQLQCGDFKLVTPTSEVLSIIDDKLQALYG